MMNYTYAHPFFFYLFALLPLLIIWYWRYSATQFEKIKVSSTAGLQRYRPTFRQRLRHLPFALRLAALAFIIIALARPQSSSKGKNIFSEGIDIVLAMDISGSMLAEDLKPNRIEAAKAVAIDFIKSRPDDRIGLVVFAGESFTQCPITSDHDVLINLFGSLKSGLLVDGTALGEGLATAVSRIKDGKTKSKVIILLTDGVNNRGAVAPITAAEIAKTFGIRVYTIGVGTMGFAPYPFQTPTGIVYQDVEVKIDEPTMQKIADLTGGEYFRATNNKKLQSIYQQIDKLEKTKVEVTEFSRHSEEFFPFAMLAALLLALEVALKYTVFKSLP
ncbi:MAG TPA: VWA domain-containing protein [Cytophagaceae bacterium]|jgi:Ca-activated chloride channel family protein|nr:VWA domain-containing protein [Cytophagaceae bacterium]